MTGCAPNWRASRAFAAVAGAALAAAACGGRHVAAPSAPAAEEGVLNVYNWADYIGHDTVAEFERETHIKVIYALYDSNETLEAKLLAGRSGYDIVSTTTGFYGRQIKAGAYIPLDKSRLPNWKNLDPQVLAIQADADPGNRYAVPYLHAMNGLVYNVDMIKARLADAPTDSLAMIFDPKVVAHFADCGVTFLDSPPDVIQLALAYLHRDPNSRKASDLRDAETLVMAVRPYIRTFDSNDYWHQLASKETCLAIAWSSDYSVAQARAREDGTGARLAFILKPQVIAEITNDIHYGNDNLAARPFVHAGLLSDPAVYPPPEVRARLYLPAELGQDYDRLRTRVWTHIKTGQ
jgi:putrescine transport system substrate-binding protein